MRTDSLVELFGHESIHHPSITSRAPSGDQLCPRRQGPELCCQELKSPGKVDKLVNDARDLNVIYFLILVTPPDDELGTSPHSSSRSALFEGMRPRLRTARNRVHFF